jgi:hypothetical protein
VNRARKCSELLSNKAARTLCVAVVEQALKDLKDKNPVIATDAHKWIFSEPAEKIFDGAGYFLADIRWRVRLMIRQGTLAKAA